MIQQAPSLAIRCQSEVVLDLFAIKLLVSDRAKTLSKDGWPNIFQEAKMKWPRKMVFGPFAYHRKRPDCVEDVPNTGRVKALKDYLAETAIA